MTFSVRQADGRQAVVVLSDSLVACSVILGYAVIVWAWLSAYNECLNTQQHTAQQSYQSNAIDGRSPSLVPPRQLPAASPNQEAEHGCCDSPWSPDMNVLLVIFTGVSAYAAWQTWKVYRALHVANIVVQRAYVDLSHASPGLELDPSPLVKIGIKNHGNTPATVTAYNITLVNAIGPLPAVPDYDERLTERVGAVVNPKETIYDDARPHRLGGALDMGTQNMKVWVIGYVDYIDKFKARHRAGYARVYDPSIDDKDSKAYKYPGAIGAAVARDLGGENVNWRRYKKRNNLPFVTQAGYNYDRPRLPHEGNDLDEN